MERRTDGRAAAVALRITGAGGLLGVVGCWWPPSASASTPSGKATICHATGSASNPYVQITTSETAVRDGTGHNRDGHQNGEDIIPPGPFDSDGRNWDAAGRTIYDDGCLVLRPDVLPPSR